MPTKHAKRNECNLAIFVSFVGKLKLLRDKIEHRLKYNHPNIEGYYFSDFSRTQWLLNQ